MDYSIRFHGPPAAAARLPELLAARSRLMPAPGGAWLYDNPDTGVSFTLDVPPHSADGVLLSAAIPCCRPQVFGHEVTHELDALAGPLALRWEADGHAREWDATALRQAWEAANRLAIAAAAARGLAPDPSLTLPGEQVAAAWYWNWHRETLRQRLQPWVFVPPIQYVNLRGHVERCIIWADAYPIAVPEVDTVLLYRQESELPRWRELPHATLARAVLPRRRGVAVAPHWLLLYQMPPPPAMRELFALAVPVPGDKVHGIPAESVCERELLQQPAG